MATQSRFTSEQVDRFQTTLNKEIRGEDTSEDPPVPALARQFLEHRAGPDEHPPQ
jgi:hypothetical protein